MEKIRKDWILDGVSLTTAAPDIRSSRGGEDFVMLSQRCETTLIGLTILTRRRRPESPINDT